MSSNAIDTHENGVSDGENNIVREYRKEGD